MCRLISTRVRTFKRAISVTDSVQSRCKFNDANSISLRREMQTARVAGLESCADFNNLAIRSRRVC